MEKKITVIAKNIIAMPTYDFPEFPKFSFVIHTKDLSEPEHVHVFPANGNEKEAKIWLFPVKVEWNRGFSNTELNEAVDAVKKKKNFLARKFRQLKKKAMNPNRTAMATMTSTYTLDEIANMLEDSLVPSNIIKSYDGFWYFRFDKVNGLEPVIELEELKDKFTILFQIVDKNFKNRGWMKRFYFSNRQEMLTIEEKIQDYLDKIEET